MSALLTVADVVAAQARLQPAKIGARDSRRALTFANWHERANRLANALAGLGLAKGDRVAILAYNCVEWMEFYVGLAAAGFVAVPINFRLVAPEIAYIAQHCEARAFIVQDELVDRVEPIRAELAMGPRTRARAAVHPGALPALGSLSALVPPRLLRFAHCGDPCRRSARPTGQRVMVT